MERLKTIGKWLVIALMVIVTVLVMGGYILSPHFTVSRSVLINAPAEKVYALVVDPRAWKQWSVWNQRDPAMTIEYSGAEVGVGAAWEWTSESQGSGKMTLTTVEPGQRIGYELYFPDFGTTSSGEMRFAPDASATRVTWSMNGNMGNNPLYRWFALGADGMVGDDFEAGLANLKALAEKN